MLCYVMLCYVMLCYVMLLHYIYIYNFSQILFSQTGLLLDILLIHFVGPFLGLNTYFFKYIIEKIVLLNKTVLLKKYYSKIYIFGKHLDTNKLLFKNVLILCGICARFLQ